MTTWHSRVTGAPAVSRGYIWEPHTEPDCRISRVLNILKITNLNKLHAFLQRKILRRSCPSSFPHASILPKMHLLEEHMVQWLKQYHLAPGLMGNKGQRASIHAHINWLETTYCGIANAVERLKHVFNMYTMETAPSLQTLRPPVKTRKRKRKDTAS